VTGDHAAMEAHLLAYLRHHGSLPSSLAETLGFDRDELIGALIEMGEEGWLDFRTVWPEAGPAGVTIVTLTPAGRSVADRREGERHKEMRYVSEEFVILTRDELVAELLRGFEWTEEQVARNPRLRAKRFSFRPAKGTWNPVRPTRLERLIRSLRKFLRALAARLPASPDRLEGDEASH
jgi:DNA-binding MarR family transcriptional regulator